MRKRKIPDASQGYLLLYHLYRIGIIPKSDLTAYRGIKQDRYLQKVVTKYKKCGYIGSMLSLLNLKFVIVPYRSQVTVKVNDSEVTVSDIGKEDIALFSIDEREDMPKLTYESIELPKAKVVLRKARTTPTKEEKTQDKSDNN